MPISCANLCLRMFFFRPFAFFRTLCFSPINLYSIIYFHQGHDTKCPPLDHTALCHDTKWSPLDRTAYVIHISSCKNRSGIESLEPESIPTHATATGPLPLVFRSFMANCRVDSSPPPPMCPKSLCVCDVYLRTFNSCQLCHGSSSQTSPSMRHLW